ncbi:MAG: DUF389 domain-containing protein [Flavobacteriaceae bacterium]|nr:DUF389 domain-containing protein [Flavobacteriaceae bacterium]
MRINNLWNLHQGEETQNKVLEDVLKNISFKGANLWILACAILIASIGLNVNSTAVIIGAMLISPLMGPIVGIGFALATYDLSLLKKSGKNLLTATVVSLLVSAIYFFISPFKEAQSEILARTSPNIYDVLIAFIGGIVGVISITRVEKGNPIPGVAIATALMPPLCTAGFGLSTFNFNYFIGAMYLYSINCFFIAIATFVIAKYLKYKPVAYKNPDFDKKIRYGISFMMLLLIVPSCLLAYQLIKDRKYTQNIENFIKTEFTDNGYTIIYKKINQTTQPKKIELAFLNDKLDSLEIKRFNNKLKSLGIEDTKLFIKQSTSDLKSEILAEINKQNTQFSEKDLVIQKLREELGQYKVEQPHLAKEIKILFPEIENISIGKLNSYNKKDSSYVNTVVLYQANKEINEQQLKNWLSTKLEDNSLKLVKQK